MPEYEEREAAQFGLYTWTEWSALPRDDRVQGVAHYRLHRLIDAHLEVIGEALSEQAARRRTR